VLWALPSECCDSSCKLATTTFHYIFVKITAREYRCQRIFPVVRETCLQSNGFCKTHDTWHIQPGQTGCAVVGHLVSKGTKFPPPSHPIHWRTACKGYARCDGSGCGLILRYYPRMCLEGLWKRMKNWSLGRDLNSEPAEWMPGENMTSVLHTAHHADTENLNRWLEVFPTFF
jgi:hypothetical protein